MFRQRATRRASGVGHRSWRLGAARNQVVGQSRRLGDGMDVRQCVPVCARRSGASRGACRNSQWRYSGCFGGLNDLLKQF